jgi:hypothetical protein
MFSFVSFDISDKAIALLFCCFWPLFQKWNKWLKMYEK